MRNNRPFQPQHGSTQDARIRHIERHLSEIAAGQTARAMASAPAPPPPVISDTIPEEYVEFDNVDGHEHTLVGAAVTIAGDVTGTNQAATVVKIEGTPIPAPVAGDDQKVIQYNHGTVAFRYTAFPSSTITVQEGDVTVDAAVTTLDFGSGFDVTSSPAGEANIALDLSEAVTGDVTFSTNAGTVAKIQGFAIPAPVAGDDQKVVQYNHGTTAYRYTAFPTATITVQEGDGTVDSAVTTLDFGSGFDVTSSPAGEANIALDLSEVATGDVLYTGNSASVSALRGVALAIPGAGDDLKFVQYVHGSPVFSYSNVPTPTITVQEGDVTVDSAVSTLDFGSGFDVTSSPSGEANVTLDLSEAVTGDVTFSTNAGTVAKIQGFAIPAPVAGDDLKVIKYNHGTTAFVYAALATPTITVQEGDSTVDSAVTTLDFGSGFDVTSSPAGEANIALDLSEAVTGDVTFTANAGLVEKIRGKTVGSLGSGDDRMYLQYDHTNSQFDLTGNRFIVDRWYYDNVSGAFTLAMNRAATGTYQQSWFPVRAGSITGVGIVSSEARTAGSVQCYAQVNGFGGGGSAAAAILDGTNTTKHQSVVAPGIQTFAAGDEIQVFLSDIAGTWAPTTADMIAFLEITE